MRQCMQFLGNLVSLSCRVLVAGGAGGCCRSRYLWFLAWVLGTRNISQNSYPDSQLVD